MMSPRGQHRLFLTLSPSQEQLIYFQEQHTTERILEHGGKAEAPPCTSETKTDYIRFQ